jgi:hypothetical protein
MFDRWLPARAMVLALALGASPAMARPMAVDGASVSAGLKALGLPAQPSNLAAGPAIDSTFGENEAFTVYLLGCDGEQKNCHSIQFWAGFTDSKAGVQEMNAFNLKYRFGRGVIDEDGEPALFLDLPTGAINDEEFREAVRVWQQLMGVFGEAIYPS